MTTTTAMPELPEPDLYAHELILNGGGVWLGVPEKGICEQAHIEGETGEEIREFYTADQMRAYALATLQAQPAEVSDVIAMVRERYRGTKWGKAAECICDAVDEAILALRPQAVPMTLEPTNDVGLVPVVIKPLTPAQRRRLWDNSPEIHKDAASITGFERIVSLTERAHGITAQGGEG